VPLRDVPMLARLLDGAAPRPGEPTQVRPAPAPAVLGDVRCWLAAPMAVRGESLGLLLAGSDAISAQQAEMAVMLAEQGALAYQNARLFSEVRRLASTDELTGLHNRRNFLDLAVRELARGDRHDLPVAALMVDIDHFKQINDTYGHAVGDEVIRVVADRLARACRQSDVLGRYGGEEFAVLGLGAPPGSRALAERLRAAIADEPVDTSVGSLAVTISVGLADEASVRVAGDRAAVLEELLGRADRALYTAKHAGRNGVAAA
jgi:diguanylate cyclase (GGDEF)-like protein